MTLLEQALAVPDATHIMQNITAEETELVIAYIEGRVSRAQIASVTGRTSATTASWIAFRICAMVQSGQLRFVKPVQTPPAGEEKNHA